MFLLRFSLWTRIGWIEYTFFFCLLFSLFSLLSPFWSKKFKKSSHHRIIISYIFTVSVWYDIGICIWNMDDYGRKTRAITNFATFAFVCSEIEQSQKRFSNFSVYTYRCSWVIYLCFRLSFLFSFSIRMTKAPKSIQCLCFVLFALRFLLLRASLTFVATWKFETT